MALTREVDSRSYDDGGSFIMFFIVRESDNLYTYLPVNIPLRIRVLKDNTNWIELSDRPFRTSGVGHVCPMMGEDAGEILREADPRLISYSQDLFAKFIRGQTERFWEELEDWHHQFKGDTGLWPDPYEEQD